VTLGDGVATLTTKKLTLGAHTIRVIYHGDSDFNGTSPVTLREVIKKPARGKKSRARIRLATRENQGVADPTPRAPEDDVRSTWLRDLALEIAISEWSTHAGQDSGHRNRSRFIRSASPRLSS